MSDNGQQPEQKRPEEMTADDIRPMPVPFGYKLGDIRMADGTKIIQFTITMPTGETTVFMPPEFAGKIGRDLLERSSGIEVARQVPPSRRFTPKTN